MKKHGVLVRDRTDDVRGGPGELARRVIERRRALTDQALASVLAGDLSDDWLRRLLRLAYELSFRKDEGRFPRITIVVPAKRERLLLDSLAVKFDPPLDAGVNMLRRIAAAVPPRPHAVLLKVIDNRLCCIGIGRFETAGAMLPEDQTGLYLRAEGLVVEISGPGDLTVSEAKEVNSIRAGRVTPQFDGNRAVRQLPLLTNLTDRVGVAALPQAGNQVRKKIHAAIADLLMYVLKSMVALGHGGTLAIMPTDADNVGGLRSEWRRQLQVAWPADGPALLDHLGDYVAARWGTSTLARYSALQALTDAAFTVSRLSATDGFVLLNRRLRTVGFGAKIGWEGAVPPRIVEENDRLEPTIEPFLIGQAGTRHAAAYRLCRAIPSVHVFVVSQDAELRFFFSDATGGVHVTAPLTPVTYLFQGV